MIKCEFSHYTSFIQEKFLNLNLQEMPSSQNKIQRGKKNHESFTAD